MTRKYRRNALSISTIIFCLTLVLFNAYAAAPTIQQLEALLRAHPENIKTRESLSQLYVSKKNFDKVIEILAPYSNEISFVGLEQLALAYGQTKDSLDEIRTLTQLTEKDPKHFRPQYFLGLAYKHADKMTEAAQSLRKSIDLAPSHRPSYDALLEIFVSTKQNYEARVLLTEMVQQFGPKQDILTSQCKLFAIDGFLKEATSTCKKAITLGPMVPENHVYLAQTYYDLNNTQAAERIFMTAARQFKKSEFVQYAAGQYYFTEKNFPTAVRYLIEAVNLNPKSLRSQLTLANALYESKQYDAALVHYTQACRLDKSKESVTQLKTAAARLRKENNSTNSEKYDIKASTCQG
jgi:tetratricopeptide (TPR) repeat protein